MHTIVKLIDPGTERSAVEVAGPRAELIRRQKITLTLKQRIKDAMQAGDEYRSAGMEQEALLAYQLADTLEARL